MRRGEFAGLTWRTLDLDGARLSVEQQLVPTRGGATFGPPKSSRSRRTVALDADTVTALLEQRAAQLVERSLAGDAYADLDLVFADALGGHVHPQRLTQWFSEHRKAAGLPSGDVRIEALAAQVEICLARVGRLACVGGPEDERFDVAHCHGRFVRAPAPFLAMPLADGIFVEVHGDIT